MLDIRRIRKDPEAVAGALARRGFVFDRDRFEQLDAERKELDMKSQALLAQRNQAAKEVGKLVREGVPVEEAKATVEQTIARLGEELETIGQRTRETQAALDDFLSAIPNPPAEEVPDGADESGNVEVSRWGQPNRFDFQPRDHVALGADRAWLDFEAASRITGARFVVMRGSLARLHRALAQFMLDLHTMRHGYTEVNVPFIVNRDSLFGTGQLPKFEADLFRLEGEQGYYLIPTAEVPVTNLLRDGIADELPLRFVCHTPCFRSEAGSHGRDTRGMIRQHQFEKVELVQFVSPAHSAQALEELTGHAEAVLQALELPYRKVMLCAGDMGFSSLKTYDLEVWLPGQEKYREISSCSSFGDFQARRMMARWRNPESGKPEYLHTLNGSGLAIGRTLVAVMENCQRHDGSIAIPRALQPYMGGLTTIGA